MMYPQGEAAWALMHAQTQCTLLLALARPRHTPPTKGHHADRHTSGAHPTLAAHAVGISIAQL